MNKKKWYIILGVLVILLAAVVILYFSLFGKTQEEVQDLNPMAGSESVPVLEEIKNDAEEKALEEEYAAYQVKLSGAVEKFLAQKPIPEEFKILDVMSQMAGENGDDVDAVKMNIQLGDVTGSYARQTLAALNNDVQQEAKAAKEAAEAASAAEDTSETKDNDTAQTPEDEQPVRITSTEKVGKYEVTVTYSELGYVLRWDDDVYWNRLILQLEMTDANKAECLKWVEKLQ